jgi:hypothetical protein
MVMATYPRKPVMIVTGVRLLRRLAQLSASTRSAVSELWKLAEKSPKASAFAFSQNKHIGQQGRPWEAACEMSTASETGHEGDFEVAELGRK